MKPYRWTDLTDALALAAGLAVFLAAAMHAPWAGFAPFMAFCVLTVTSTLIKSHSRSQAGSLLLCLPGRYPSSWRRGCFIGMMALFVIWTLIAMYQARRSGETNRTLDLSFGNVLLMWAVLNLWQRIGPVEIRENGIVYSGGLIRWVQMETYAWERGDPGARKEDADILCLTARLAWPSLVSRRNRPVRLSTPVRPSQKEAVERLLAQYGLRGEGEGGNTA